MCRHQGLKALLGDAFAGLLFALGATSSYCDGGGSAVLCVPRAAAAAVLLLSRVRQPPRTGQTRQRRLAFRAGRLPPQERKLLLDQLRPVALAMHGSCEGPPVDNTPAPLWKKTWFCSLIAHR